MENIKDKVERYKVLADIFIKNNTKAFIKDSDDTFYFCNLVLSGEDYLFIECFAPEQRKGQKYKLYWALIQDFKEYRGRKEEGEE